MRYFIAISAALLASGAMAAPTPAPAPSLGDLLGGLVDNVKNKLFPSKITGTLDPALLPDINYFAEYAAAGYCNPNQVPGTEVVCVKDICPTVQANTVFTAIEFADTGAADTTGIVARDDTTKNIVVIFRGSHSLQNWLTNANIAKVDVPWCSGCKAHEGFWKAWQEERARITDEVARLRAEKPSYGLVTVGHSLGGALAQLAAADFRVNGVATTAYTFGSPRISNDPLSLFITANGPNFRVTHLDDPVPRVPLMMMGYSHVSPEYHIHRGDSGLAPEDINVLDGTINFGGNTADDGLISADILAHLRYVLPSKMGDCADSFFDGINIKS